MNFGRKCMGVNFSALARLLNYKLLVGISPLSIGVPSSHRRLLGVECLDDELTETQIRITSLPAFGVCRKLGENNLLVQRV